MRHEVPVMFLAARGEPRDVGQVSQQLFDHLEARLDSLTGRRFFRVYLAHESEYRACVQTQKGEDAEELGLQRGVIPGGPYLRARLRGEPPGVYDHIGPTFGALQAHAQVDRSRPSIKFYRRRDEIDLLVPVE